MSNKLTKKQIESYLKDSQQCPYCGSRSAGAYSPELINGIVIRMADCDECEAEWQEVYTLTDVKEIE